MRHAERRRIILHEARDTRDCSVSRYLHRQLQHIARCLGLPIGPPGKRTDVLNPPCRHSTLCRRVLRAPAGAQPQLAAAPGRSEKILEPGDGDVHELPRDVMVFLTGREGDLAREPAGAVAARSLADRVLRARHTALVYISTFVCN